MYRTNMQLTFSSMVVSAFLLLIISPVETVAADEEFLQKIQKVLEDARKKQNQKSAASASDAAGQADPRSQKPQPGTSSDPNAYYRQLIEADRKEKEAAAATAAVQAASAARAYYDLGEKQRNAVDWSALRVYKDAFNLVQLPNSSLSFDPAFVAKMTGNTEASLMELLDKAVEELQTRERPREKARLIALGVQSPEQGVEVYFKRNDEYLIRETVVKQKLVDRLPVDRVAYKIWREAFIREIALYFLPGAISRYEQAQNSEAQAKAAAPARIDINYLIKNGQVMDDGSGRVVDNMPATYKQEIYREYLAHRSGCDWKSGIYFSQPNPTSSSQCVKPNRVQ